MIIFDVNKLNLWYGQNHALQDVSIGIESHSITALIGPSGCGKSTFLRTLNRMNDLISTVSIKGIIRYGDTDILGPIDVIELRKRVGMVFQKPNPFPMSIFDNIAYGPRVHGMYSHSRGQRAELAELVEESLVQAALFDEVKDRLHRSAMTLSGGQQQRLCIARVLAVRPEVILLDEPTSALDPASTARIESLLQDLKRLYTIIIVTHNMQQAGRISDRTGFFLLGKLIEWAPTSEIFFNPKDKRTEDYISGHFG